MVTRHAAALAISATALAAAPAGAQVFLRGEADPLPGAVAAVTPQGVRVGEGRGARLVSWDRVRAVKGEHAAEAEPFMAVSDALWRARVRAERGDAAGAEAAAEPLAVPQAGAVGPSAAVAFDVLTRARLGRSVQTRAVFSWLAWLGARGGLSSPEPNSWRGGAVDAPPLLDPATGLIPALPPVWLHDAALEAAAASPDWGALGKLPDDVSPLAALFRAAMRAEAGLNADLSTPAAGDGSRLVQAMVLARHGDEAQRASARGYLEKRLLAKDAPAWVELWCRVGLGRSLVRETDAALRRRGVVQLLHAPARFARSAPYLASVALAEAALACHELGDEAGAQALKTELAEAFPQSGAAVWPRLREIKGPLPGAPARAAAEPASAKEGS